MDGAISAAFGDTVRTFARDEIGKPLLGAVLTHGHPDHVLGLGHILADASLPIIALSGALEQAKRRQESDVPAMRMAFGGDFPEPVRLPDTIVDDGQTVSLGGISFKVTEYGPGESDCDATWALEGTNAVFCGDLVYNRMHLFLRDGHESDWRQSLDRLGMTTGPETRLFPGHGDICGGEAIAWTRDYLDMATHQVAEIAASGVAPDLAKKQFLAAIEAFLPGGALLDLASYELEQTLSAVAADIINPTGALL